MFKTGVARLEVARALFPISALHSAVNSDTFACFSFASVSISVIAAVRLVSIFLNDCNAERALAKIQSFLE